MKSKRPLKANPVKSPAELADPEVAAACIRAMSGTHPGSPPSTIAEALGIPVSVRPSLGDRVLGRYSDGRIAVAPSLDARLREETIGHELAHWLDVTIIGEGVQSAWDWRDGGLVEVWCDRVAAALLMPLEDFIESARECRWQRAALEKKWANAPPRAIERRLGEVVPIALRAA